MLSEKELFVMYALRTGMPQERMENYLAILESNALVTARELINFVEAL